MSGNPPDQDPVPRHPPHTAEAESEDEWRQEASDSMTGPDDVRPAVLKPRHTVDRGWAWMVCAGSFLILTVMKGIFNSYGLFYVEIQDKFHVPASIFSLIGGTASGMDTVGAFVTMNFALTVLSERQCVLIGAFIEATAFSLSCFVTSFPVLVVTMGAITGFCNALMYGPMFVLLGKYFRRHLVLAQAITNTGSSVGGFSLPVLIRAILHHFSFPMALLVIDGVQYHMLVCAFLFRPVHPSHLPAPAHTETQSECDDLVENETRENTGLRTVNNGARKPVCAQNDNIGATRSSGDAAQGDASEYSLQQLDIDDTEADMQESTATLKDQQEAVHTKKPSRCFDFEAWKSLPVWGLVVHHALGTLPGSLGQAFLPPLAREVGLSDTAASFLLTLMGGLDIASRLLPGVIAHYGLLKPHQMVLISLVLLGLLFQLLTWLRSYEGLVGFCTVLGCLSGVFFSMSQAVIIQYVGLDQFRVVFGITLLFNGVSRGVNFPLTGALRDVTGTYVTSFHYLGAMALVSAAALAALPFLCRLQQRLHSNNTPHRDVVH